MKQILYSEIIAAVKKRGEPFDMKVNGRDKHAVATAASQGIDAHLEACCIKGRDSYHKKNGRLLCKVSAESMPVLIRRLVELGDEAGAEDLAVSILGTLDFQGLEAGDIMIVKERCKNPVRPDDEDEVRYEHMTPSEFAAQWGSDKYPHTLFYNYSESQHDPEFLKEFLPVIDQTIAEIKDDPERQNDVEDLEEFKTDVQHQLDELSQASS